MSSYLSQDRLPDARKQELLQITNLVTTYQTSEMSLLERDQFTTNVFIRPL